MRVLLISANIAKSPYPVYPLGMSTVAGALTTAGYSIEQFDYLHNNCSVDLLVDKIKSFLPEIIGISLRNIDTTNKFDERTFVDVVRDIVTIIRKNTSAKIVIGGSGFSIMPETILDCINVDYGIVGEGERLFVNFLDNARRNIYPDKKCLYADSKLDGKSIAVPSYDANIMSYYLKHGGMLSVQTKRGCPYNCTYCSYPLLEGRKLRARKDVEVVDDIIKLRDEHGAKFLFFTDSVFNDDEGHYINVLKEMKSRKVSIPWAAFMKPCSISKNIIELMKETGLKAAEVGADASTDASLKSLKKPFSFADIIEFNTSLRSYDIPTAHYFMFGVPGENKDLVREGIQNILSLQNTVSFIFMGIRILPGTSILKTAVEDKIIRPDDKLLNPVYYFPPELDREWLKNTLYDAFKNERNCIFPPNKMDDYIDTLHEMGHIGVLWDLLLKTRVRRRRRNRNR